jgi:hypothetical protein
MQPIHLTLSYMFFPGISTGHRAKGTGHMVREAVAKYAKLKPCDSNLCDLCVEPLRPLRLMDFDFLNNLTKRVSSRELNG